MKQKQVIIIASAVVVLALAGWGGYKLFSKTTTVRTVRTSIEPFAKHAAWVYHEYVYRVDFSDTALRPFLFVQNSDGTFSPSQADSSGNHIAGNGFIMDSTGALMLTDRLAQPWTLSATEEKPLREMVDSALAGFDFVKDRNYRITGQTVALFAVLNDPKDLIEYNIVPAAPGQDGYALAYPAEKISLAGMNVTPAFGAIPAAGNTILRIVKTVMDRGTAGSVARTVIDSVAADVDAAGYIGQLNAFKSDGFFNEGSVVFDSIGSFIGQLHYDNNKWKIVPVKSFVASPPVYADLNVKETWGYEDSLHMWVRTSKIIAPGER